MSRNQEVVVTQQQEVTRQAQVPAVRTDTAATPQILRRIGLGIF